MDKLVSVLNTNVDNIKENLNIYLSEIKSRTTTDDYNDFINNLKKVDKDVKLNIKLDKNSLNLICNIIKTFMVQQKRIQVGDDVSVEMASYAEKYKKDVDILKNYISNLTNILDENKINIPEIPPLCLESSVTAKSSFDKRLEILRISSQKDGDIHDYIKNIKKGKLIQIPNEIMKKAAKENGVNIKMRETEVNKVIVN